MSRWDNNKNIERKIVVLLHEGPFHGQAVVWASIAYSLSQRAPGFSPGLGLASLRVPNLVPFLGLTSWLWLASRWCSFPSRLPWDRSLYVPMSLGQQLLDLTD